MKNTKYIFVTGGVLSGLGKGITAASIGNILTSRGFSVFMQKFDQYLNVDAGTLNPAEHGEVFVTDDGAETDLDLGHYERFIDVNLTRASSVMSGQIYQAILEKERAGKFLGKTIQMIPHVTNEVKERIFQAARESDCDVLITEIGGTIGDYEGTHFIEAIRQMPYDVGKDNVLYVHVGFLPYLEVTEELKSKPLQNSIYDLQSMGIHPDIVMCRSDHKVTQNIINKVALFGGLEKEAVIPLETVKTVYEVPLILEKYNLDSLIIDKLKLPHHKHKDGQWSRMVSRIKKPKDKSITISLVGKYMGMKDTYISIIEALKAASWANNLDIQIDWIDSEILKKEGTKLLKGADGILVPGGFGNRGIEGKILAAKYARTHKIPYLGLCLGLQIAVIEFARNVCKMPDANSTEFNSKTPCPVIHIMSEQEKLLEGSNYGGTMRLGAYPCTLQPNTLAHQIYNEPYPKNVIASNAKQSSHVIPNSKNAILSRVYPVLIAGKNLSRHPELLPRLGGGVSESPSSVNRLLSSEISERHRHRYEVNNEYRDKLVKCGLVFSGLSPNGHLVEMIELPNHPFYLASQFHPEFKSRPNKPHPMFINFIKACIK